MSTALIVLGFIIIVALSSYATFLLLKLKQQKQRQQVAHAEREVAANAKRAQILGDIRYIATAMIEDRCEISEGVVRIGRLFEILSLSERVAPEFPSLFQHFELIKGHPIMEARHPCVFSCYETCELTFADANSHLPPAAEKQRYGRSRIASKQKQLSQFILPLLAQLEQQQAGSLLGLNFGRILDDESLTTIENAGHKLNQYDPFFAPDHETLKQEYDFICCYRVFEHFKNPIKEWRLLSRLLRLRGWLAISTPLLIDLDGFAKWHHKNNLTHVSFYQRQTFEFLANNSDFELLFAAKDLVLMQKTS